jgi:hypothetical protein
MRLTMLLRRVHLYAGLFLLPWVFLYGISGALFNHYGLFPDVQIETVSAAAMRESPMKQFPSAQLLAEQVVEQIQNLSPDNRIELDPAGTPEFVNDVILQVSQDELKHAVHIDPVAKSAWVASGSDRQHKPKDLLSNVEKVTVASRPYELAQQSVPDVLESAGIEASNSPQPLGWCKLNFLAVVDGTPARVTYVLRDGHVDVTEYEGKSGMSTRAFLLRLHTSHGQPPHWNARMVWSLFVDVMAIAMVTWGLTGLVMWWQMKRTRLVGGFVILASIATALMMYLSMIQFYATSKL